MSMTETEIRNSIEAILEGDSDFRAQKKAIDRQMRQHVSDRHIRRYKINEFTEKLPDTVGMRHEYTLLSVSWIDDTDHLKVMVETFQNLNDII